MSEVLTTREEVPRDRGNVLIDSLCCEEGLRLRRKLKGNLLRLYLNDGAVLEHFVSLDIRDDRLAALFVIPIVEVAWADGNVDDKEREAILAAAEAIVLGRGSASTQLLRHWLTQRPDRGVRAAWNQYVAAFSATLGHEAKIAFKRELLESARSVAEAAGGLLGLGNNISKSEHIVLDELEQAFA